ncbi:MAG: Crp/Fnr family transcriptional regulator [Flavitalea sp.]
MNKTISIAEKWAKTGGHSPLFAFFNAIHPINEAVMEVLDRESSLLEVKKGNFLVKPGLGNDSLFLILQGVIRGYIRESGKEITTWINDENEIVGTIRNMGLNLPCDEYVQAIENSRVVVIPFALIEYLYEHFPEGNIIGRKLLEHNYRGSEERAYICRIPSAEKKYKRFMATQASLINRISLKYIASYLGMTLETISRVRNRK